MDIEKERKMTSERAKKLLEMMGPFCELPMAFKCPSEVNEQWKPKPFGITREEDAFLKSLMPVHYTYLWSLMAVANGNAKKGNNNA